jgi:hypothetical protein
VLSTGIASNAAIGWLGSSSKGRLPVVTSHEGTHMLDPQKTLEREALLRRRRELQAEIAQHERNMREGEARLPLEEQLRLKLRRFIEANIPELAGKVRVEISCSEMKPG